MAISSPVAIYAGCMPLCQVGSLGAWARLRRIVCEVRQQSNVFEGKYFEAFSEHSRADPAVDSSAACTDINTTANISLLAFARMPVPTTVL